MAPLDTRAGFMALLGIALRNFDPRHHESTTQEVVSAAADIYDAAVRHIQQRDLDYHRERGEDGLTQAEHDAGWTLEQVQARDAKRELPQLPAIAAAPGNDQLAVLAALHADVDVIDQLRAEAAEEIAGADVLPSLFAEIAEHYPGVANELRAYVLHPDREQAARAAGGARFLTVEDGGEQGEQFEEFSTDEDRNAARMRELDELHRNGQVTSRRVPGDYVPPDTQRDTSGDAVRNADEVARQDRGRQAFNAGQGELTDADRGMVRLYETNEQLAADIFSRDPRVYEAYADARGRMVAAGELMPQGALPAPARADVHAAASRTMHAPSREGNGELPELAAARELTSDDAGQIQEIGGGAIQQDDAPGQIQQDDSGGAIQQDDTGGHLQEPLSEDDGGHIQGGDDQGAMHAPQQ